LGRGERENPILDGVRQAAREEITAISETGPRGPIFKAEQRP